MKIFSLLMLTVLLISQNSFASSLQSSVDRHKISENETLSLTITLDDASFSGSPEIAGLDSNFQILSQRSNSSTTIINGTYSSKKEWHYTLLPKKTGKLLIPSFKLKDMFSDAIEIDVTNANSGTATTQQADIFLEQSVDKNIAYTQERITLTLQIFTAIDIARPEIPNPVFPGFMVEKIGQAEYQSKRDGQNYYVLEYKYGLFPNQSGNVTLPKQRFQISQIINNPRSAFNFPGFGSPNTQTRMLSTPEILLTIKPQPDNLPATYWLPTENVTIKDNWPEQQTVQPGTALTRRIEIKASGSLAAHIPSLPTDNIQGLKTYAEQAELATSINNDNFLATRKENIAVVATRPGTYILPAIQIHWWDTKSRQFKTSTLPERTLTVEVDAAAPLQQQTPANPLASSPEPSIPVSPIPVSAPTPFYMQVYLWMGATIIFIMLWIATLVVMVKRKIQAPTDADIISAAGLARQASLKEKLKHLRSACQSSNAIKARALLIDWAQLQWPDTNILTLDQLKHQVKDDRFAVLLNELDASIYRSSGSWNGKQLGDFLGDIKFTDNTGKEAKLPSLYQ
jgi:hypothetical protein